MRASNFRRAGVLVLCIGGLAVWPAPGVAGPPASPAPAAVAAARRYFEEANRAYDKAQFSEALKLYSKAFDLTQYPAFLFNMGQCEKYLGHWDKAEFLYTRYLALDPKPRDPQLVKDLIAEMRARQKPVTPPPTPTDGPFAG